MNGNYNLLIKQNIFNFLFLFSNRIFSVLPVPTLFIVFYLAMNFGGMEATQAQTTSNNVKQSTITINQGTPLAFAQENVSKYFPDMKGHVDEMMGKILNQDEANAINKFFNETVMKINDPKQKTAAIILCLEMYVITDVNAKFGETHADDVDGKTGDTVQAFFDVYSVRIKNYNDNMDKKIAEGQRILDELQKEIEQDKKEIEQDKKEIEQDKKEIEQTKSKTVQRKEHIKEMRAFLIQEINKYSELELEKNPGLRASISKIKAFLAESE